MIHNACTGFILSHIHRLHSFTFECFKVTPFSIHKNNIFYCNRDCSSRTARHIEHSSLNYSGLRSSTRENVFIANKQTICRCHLPAAVLLCGCGVCISCACAAKRGGVFLYLHILYIYIHICTFLFVYLFILLAVCVDPPSEIFNFSSPQVSASSIDTLFFLFLFFFPLFLGSTLLCTLLFFFPPFPLTLWRAPCVSDCYQIPSRSTYHHLLPCMNNAGVYAYTVMSVTLTK